MRDLPRFYYLKASRTVARVDAISYQEEFNKYKKLSQRRRIKWRVTAEARLTNGNNCLIKGQDWTHPTFDIVRDVYPAKDSREQIEGFFAMQLRRKLGREISEEEYTRLKEEFENEIELRSE